MGPTATSRLLNLWHSCKTRKPQNGHRVEGRTPSLGPCAMAVVRTKQRGLGAGVSLRGEFVITHQNFGRMSGP